MKNTKDMQEIFEQIGIIDIVCKMVENNEKQLSLPLEKRQYLCVRISNVALSHISVIVNALKEKEIKTKDVFCVESKMPGIPFITGTLYTGDVKVRKQDKYVVIYFEANHCEHTDFDLKVHNDLRRCAYYPQEGYLGTIVLFEGNDDKYKSDAPRRVYEQFEEYEYHEKEEPDVFIV